MSRSRFFSNLKPPAFNRVFCRGLNVLKRTASFISVLQNNFSFCKFSTDSERNRKQENRRVFPQCKFHQQSHVVKKHNISLIFKLHIIPCDFTPPSFYSYSPNISFASSCCAERTTPSTSTKPSIKSISHDPRGLSHAVLLKLQICSWETSIPNR